MSVIQVVCTIALGLLFCGLIVLVLWSMLQTMGGKKTLALWGTVAVLALLIAGAVGDLG